MSLCSASTSRTPRNADAPAFTTSLCFWTALTCSVKVYLSVTYALNTFGLSFATVTSLVMWLLLEKWQDIAHGLRTLTARLGLGNALMETPNSSNSSQTGMQDPDDDFVDTVPWWWYAIAGFIGLFLAMFCMEYWTTQLRWYGVLLAVAVLAFFYVPVCPGKLNDKQ
jgi:hypothetical protein